MQLTYVDSTASLTMRLEIGKLVIVFVAFVEFSLGRVIAKFDSYWLYNCGSSLFITIYFVT